MCFRMFVEIVVYSDTIYRAMAMSTYMHGPIGSVEP